MQIDWREALVFVTREPLWKRRIGAGGLPMRSCLVISQLFLPVLARVHDNERAKRAAPQLQQVLT